MVEPQPVNLESPDPIPAVDLGPGTNAEVAAPARHEDSPPGKNGHAIPAGQQPIQQLLRPIVQGIEALARAQVDHSDVVERMEKVLADQQAMPKLLAETKQALEQRNTVSRAMFEALHGELKSYKDGFLMESVLRPVIRDLISVYDDISEIHRQLAVALAAQEKRGDLTAGTLMLFENVLSPTSQLEHNCDSIIEVLERLSVTLMPSIPGKLDKQCQRAVSIEVAEDPDQDQQVVKVVKRGFKWNDRVFRPEEVVIKRWKEGFLAALAPADAKA